MTDYPYDPDLPFAVVIPGSETVYARFRLRGSAEDYAEDTEGSTWANVIDTTPKPRIPDDAEFVCWQTSAGMYYAQRVEAEWQTDTGGWYTLDELLNEAGDAEIIVLDRRKDDA